MPKKIEPLTAQGIEALPIPESGFRDYPDGKGLRLRVWSERGGRVTKTWMFRYTVRATGQSRLMKLGEYGSADDQLGLSDARRLCEDHRYSIRNGGDPQIGRAHV